MLSGRLVCLIEDHWNEIARRVVRRLRNDPHFNHIRRLPEAELREWAQEILENLHHWLADAREEEVTTHFEAQGRLRYQEEVPLHESVRGLFVLKDKTIEFVQEQGGDKDSLALYAEEELENYLGRFFDLAVCALVAGYVRAMRRAHKISMAV